MVKTVFISVMATLVCATALFAGAASATGFLTRRAQVADIVAPPAPDIAGDCVVQTRWVNNGVRMVQVERPVCY